MFGFFKSKPLVDQVAEAMAKLACDVNVGSTEAQAVRSGGVDLEIYRVELTCFQIYSVLFGFLIWEGRLRLGQQEEEVIPKFYSQVEAWCSKNSPRPSAFYSHIRQRLAEYHAAQEEDMSATEQGAVSMGLPSQFVRNIATPSGEIPFELMPGTSARFHHYVKKTGETLNAIRIS